jgi:ribonuclease P protein component
MRGVARVARVCQPEEKSAVLPAGNRLRRRQDFATAVRRGRRAGRPLVVAHVAHVPVDGHLDLPAEGGSVDMPVARATPRVGFIVSRAVGSAVVRNAVKRRLRHLVRDRLDRLPAGALVVIRALPPSATASAAELAADLDASLERALRVRSSARPLEGRMS